MKVVINTTVDQCVGEDGVNDVKQGGAGELGWSPSIVIQDGCHPELGLTMGVLT